MRHCVSLVVCGCCFGLFAGCSHMTEKRVVQAFSDSLHEHDLEKLQANATDGFEHKALHGPETFEAIKLVDLPEGKHKIVKVSKKKDEDTKKVVEKHVTAEVEDGEGKRRVQYVLKQDGENRGWLVDEMYLSGEDKKKGKSVGSRLAVLASLHESLDAWRSAERSRILHVATPEFAHALGELAPEQLAQFAKKITSDVAEETGLRPQERLGEETAELRVPKIDGELVLSFRRVEERWKLDDLQVKSRKGAEAIESVRHMSAAVAAAQGFQAAYRATDKTKLQTVCTQRFYSGCLENSDLSSVPLPGGAEGLNQFDVKLEGSTATFVIPAGEEILKLTLVRDAQHQMHAAPHYRVDDVTIYELKTSQDKRLSALFTGQASLAGFAAALAANDVQGLQANSTIDFNERVWKHLAAEDFPQLPLAEFEPVPPRVVQMLFKGPMTELLVEQGSTPLTYILRDHGGRLVVDDVQIPVAPVEEAAAGFNQGRPTSLKANLEFMRPVLHFASAINASEMAEVRRIVTADFARLVWNHYDEKAPDFEYDPLPYLRAPLSRVKLLPGDRAELLLGDRRFGAQVLLVRENSEYRVDDVWLISESLPDQKVGLRRTIVRPQVARRQ